MWTVEREKKEGEHFAVLASAIVLVLFIYFYLFTSHDLIMAVKTNFFRILCQLRM